MRSLAPAVLLSLCTVLPAAAQEVPPPPPMEGADAGTPPEVTEGLQPQVTIKRRERDVVEEYRIGGQLYMVKIIPSRGYPYFLIDSDGDGSLETRRNELSNPEVPQWVIFRW